MPKIALALLALALLLGACSKSSGTLGEAGDPDEVDRTVELTTSDELRFSPSEIEVKAGETIQFTVTNEAGSPHEFVIGPTHEHTAGMQHMDANATGEIQPGESASVVWYFPDAGEVAFACHIAGHDKAGMTGTITVTE